MDGDRFDRWTRALILRGSRRRFGSGLLAGAFGLLGTRAAAAVVCRAPGSLCRENADCCTGLCARDAFGRHTCQCPAGTVACDRTCVDPTTAFQTDPNNCGTCGQHCPAAACQRPICVGGVCDVEANPDANGTPCDDGNLCTENDVCQDGNCAGTPVVCTPLDQCHSAACDPTTGQCVQTLLEGSPCDDGDLCTTGETCQADGSCAGGTPIVCGQCQVCDGGICVPDPATENQPCTTTGEFGAICCGGVCADLPDDQDRLCCGTETCRAI